jgi:hypothetical protein
MDLSPVKLEILQTLLLHDQPQKPAQVAEEICKDQRAVNMHILGLIRPGYVKAPEKGSYIITEKGKAALGLPEITREKALAILKPTVQEKAFHFYRGIGKPLNIHAHDLLDFCTKLNQVNLESVDFHIKRGDFENWFAALGDVELALKASLLKKRTAGEELRQKLRDMVEYRCMALSKMVGEQTSAKV